MKTFCYQKLIWPFAIICLISACQPDTSVDAPSSQTNQGMGQVATGQQDLQTPGWPSGNNTSSINSPGQGSPQGGFQQGIQTGVDVSSLPDVGTIEYPQMEFYATGILVSIDRNPITIRSQMSLTSQEITTYIQEFSSSDSTINERVNKLVGQTVFKRTSKADIRTREQEDNFPNLSFVMYAMSSERQNGYGVTSVSFSKPVPILVVAAPMSRYDRLKQGPVTFQSSVRVNNLKFDINVTVSEISRTGNQIKVIILTDVPTDSNGQLYDLLPMPREQIFTIDTDQRLVTNYDTQNYYYNDHKKDRRDIITNGRLCRYLYQGKESRFPCQ